MAKSSDPPASGLPEDVAKLAEALVRAGRFATVEDVLRAGVEVLTGEADIDATDETVWQAYKARRPSEPRDMTAAELLACLDSDDPEKQQAFSAHVDALSADIDAGRVLPGTTAEMMADIRARLGIPPRP